MIQRDPPPSSIGELDPAFGALDGIVPLPARSAPKRRANPSLLDHLLHRFGPARQDETTLAPLILLLDAGYEPVEAGRRLMALPHPGVRLHAVAERLAEGQPLARTLKDFAMLPWLTEALQGYGDRDADAAKLLVAVARPGPAVLAHRLARRLGAECIVLSLPVLVAAKQLPAGSLPLTGAVAVLVVVALRQLLALHANNDFVRAEVLGLVAALADLRLAPALAVRAGSARLESVAGKRQVKDPTRADLAEALDLPGLSAGVLANGDLAAAATRAAAYCLETAERRAGRVSWLLRAAVLVAFGYALVLAVAHKAEPTVAIPIVTQAAPARAPLPAPAVAAPAPAPVPAPPVPSASVGSGLVLLGVAGRLPDNADVLVKTPWGKTTTMHAGDTLLGWTLVSIESDRIVLEKDGARDELVLRPS